MVADASTFESVLQRLDAVESQYRFFKRCPPGASSPCCSVRMFLLVSRDGTDRGARVHQSVDGQGNRAPFGRRRRKEPPCSTFSTSRRRACHAQRDAGGATRRSR